MLLPTREFPFRFQQTVQRRGSLISECPIFPCKKNSQVLEPTEIPRQSLCTTPKHLITNSVAGRSWTKIRPENEWRHSRPIDLPPQSPPRTDTVHTRKNFRNAAGVPKRRKNTKHCLQSWKTRDTAKLTVWSNDVEIRMMKLMLRCQAESLQLLTNPTSPCARLNEYSEDASLRMLCQSANSFIPQLDDLLSDNAFRSWQTRFFRSTSIVEYYRCLVTQTHVTSLIGSVKMQ